MAEEEKKVVSAEEDVGNIYKTKYDELVQNSVPREEYDKIKVALEEEVNNRVENRQITNKMPENEPNWEKQAHDALDKIANNKCKTNMEYHQAMCDAREAVLHTEGKDLFIQQLELQGEHYDTKQRRKVAASVVEHVPTDEEIERADRVYTGLRELIDESEGDPAKYNYLYSKKVRKANI